MALTDAYATSADYRARTGDQTAGDDPTLIAQLTSVQRELERALGLHLGAFNSHEDEYTFPGDGTDLLRLRDSSGAGYFLQSVQTDGITLDTNNDGSFDGYALDFADAWVQPLPENAAAFSEPYTEIRLLALSGADPVCWPNRGGSIKIDGTWGWATVPDIIVDLVCHRTHELRTALKEGGVGTIPAFDTEATMRPSTAWLWREIEHLYGRWVPVL